MKYLYGEIPDFTGQPLTVGSRGEQVRMVQEWLVLHGAATAQDGIFGNATRVALEKITGAQVVTASVWSTLWAPMHRALQRLASPIAIEFMMNRYGWDRVASIAGLLAARVHLEAGAKEIPPNMGPWVRLYMGGHEGAQFAWCGGFVTHCFMQGIKNLAALYPVGVEFDRITDSMWYPALPGWNVDHIGHWAIDTGRLQIGDTVPIPAGSLFLIPGTKDGDWVHVGIVEEYSERDHVITTIEGNTNVAGAREGTDVMRRYRRSEELQYVIFS